MVYIIPLWVLLWLAGIQGDIIYVNTEVDTLMASVGLNPMGPGECINSGLDYWNGGLESFWSYFHYFLMFNLPYCVST